MEEKREEIGVRELKAKASEIIRHIREERASYSITYRGEVVATLGPAGPPRELDEAFWTDLNDLRRRITAHWQPKDLSAAA